ncbi:hypothetical protein ABK040_004075 [Willaertia magna]
MKDLVVVVLLKGIECVDYIPKNQQPTTCSANHNNAQDELFSEPLPSFNIDDNIVANDEHFLVPSHNFISNNSSFFSNNNSNTTENNEILQLPALPSLPLNVPTSSNNQQQNVPSLTHNDSYEEFINNPISEIQPYSSAQQNNGFLTQQDISNLGNIIYVILQRQEKHTREIRELKQDLLELKSCVVNMKRVNNNILPALHE